VFTRLPFHWPAQRQAGTLACSTLVLAALLVPAEALAGGRYGVGVGVGIGGPGYRGYVGYGTGWGGYRAGYWTGYRPAYWGGAYAYRPAYWGGWGPGWGWGSYWGPGPWWGGYWGPYYAPPVSVVTVPVSPPVYIEQQTAPPPASSGGALESGWWYYCRNPAGYYPYVDRCPDGWVKVPPRPADAPQ
jgi:hypothetical protein